MNSAHETTAARTDVTSNGATHAVGAVVHDVLAGGRFDDLFLVDLVVRGREGGRVVEVFVDSDDALSVDRIAEVNREIGRRLETADALGAGWRLDVSSPGVHRPLKHPRQYRKHLGRTLTVRRHDENGGNVAGVLTGLDEDSITLDLGGNSEVIRFNQILEGKVALPW